MWHTLRTVLKGELRYHLREPLTLLVLVLMPLLVYPALLFTFSRVGTAQKARLDEQVLVVAAPPGLAPHVLPGDHLKIVEGGFDPADLTGDRPVVEVSFGPDHSATLKYRGDVAKSRRARKRVNAALERWRRDDQAASYRALQLDVAPADVLKVNDDDRSSRSDRSGDLLGRLIPLILVFLLSSGGLHTALDVLTGEKDRGTLETLLTTRADRRMILLGKFLIVLGFTLTSGLLSLASLWASVRLGLAALPPEAGLEGGLTLPTSSVLLLLAFALPLSVQLAAVLSWLAAWAPDFRTGQALALPVVLVPAALAAVATIPQVELTAATALLPISNVALAMRETLGGGAAPGMVLLTLVATCLHAGGALWAAARLVGRESVVLGGSRGGDRRAKGDFGVEAIALFTLATLLLWFLGQIAQARDMLGGMFFTQIGLFVLPAVGMIVYLGQPVREVLSWRRPHPLDLGLAVLAGLAAPGLSLAVGMVQEGLFPMPEKFLEQFQDSLHLDQPLWVILVTFALLPGVCEELLFRGALMGLFKRTVGPWTRILLVGFLFGFIHLSVARLLPTGAIGLLLGLAVLRSGSIVVPMVIHTLHNGILFSADVLEVGALAPDLWLGWPVGLGAVAVGLVWMMGRGGRGATEEAGKGRDDQGAAGAAGASVSGI